MLCTNCFEEEYITAKTELAVTINGERRVLRDLDCETCPACGDITFTHAQSLEIDRKRITSGYGRKLHGVDREGAEEVGGVKSSRLFGRRRSKRSP